jgi:hypothetical protein
MTLQLNRVHEYKSPKDGGPAVLSRVRPVIRLGHRVEGEQDQLYVFIQGGEFYTEDGKLLPPERRPRWLMEELAKLTPEAKAEVGLKSFDKRSSPADGR